MQESQTHPTSVSVTGETQAALDAGAEMTLGLAVSCPCHCNLRGGRVRIADEAGAVVGEAALSAFDGAASETRGFVLKAPVRPGRHVWTAAFIAQEREGVAHEGSSAAFPFVVKPHTTSMAIWDLPVPIILNTPFTLTVGVKCSSGCALAGKTVQIRNQEGAEAGSGMLGEPPWPGTSSLYWFEAELRAPDAEGDYRWKVEFPDPDLGVPHEGAAGSFAFGTVRPPEHVAMVEVIDKATRMPVPNAEVTLHSGGAPFRNSTDGTGAARFSVPKGRYDVYVWAAGYEDFETAVAVEGDATIRAEQTPLPKDAN